MGEKTAASGYAGWKDPWTWNGNGNAGFCNFKLWCRLCHNQTEWWGILQCDRRMYWYGNRLWHDHCTVCCRQSGHGHWQHCSIWSRYWYLTLRFRFLRFEYHVSDRYGCSESGRTDAWKTAAACGKNSGGRYHKTGVWRQTCILWRNRKRSIAVWSCNCIHGQQWDCIGSYLQSQFPGFAATVYGCLCRSGSRSGNRSHRTFGLHGMCGLWNGCEYESCKSTDRGRLTAGNRYDTVWGCLVQREGCESLKLPYAVQDSDPSWLW